MFIDFHVHPVTDNLKLLRDRLKKIGAFAAILYPIDIDPTFNLSLKELLEFSTKFNISNTKTIFYEINKLINNWTDLMIDAMKLWYAVFKDGVHDFFIPFMSINPSFGDKYVKQKLWEMDHLGLRGVFMSPILQLFDIGENKAFHTILEYSERNNILVVLHLGLPPIVEGNSYKDLLRTVFQRLDYILNEYRPDIVISGLGITPDITETWFSGAVRLMKRFDNIYLSTADINCYIFSGKSTLKINDLGTDRLLFSSGYPYRRIRDVLHGIKCVKDGILHDSDKESVLFYNALELLKYHDFTQYLQYLNVN